MLIDKSDLEVLALTVYLEARGECKEGWEWIIWVIKNRKRQNPERWGHTIKEVCLKESQFECFNIGKDISVQEKEKYREIHDVCKRLIDADMSLDPTRGCNHYNNPKKEKGEWVPRVTKVKKIGDHVFYRE